MHGAFSASSIQVCAHTCPRAGTGVFQGGLFRPPAAFQAGPPACYEKQWWPTASCAADRSVGETYIPFWR